MRIFRKLPDHISYVPADFEKDNLLKNLTAAGYKSDVKTLFIWEGVSKYLTAKAVDEMLCAVSCNSCRDSSIVFDYLFQSMVDGGPETKLADKVLAFQARRREPFIFGLPQENPERLIMSRGFSSVKNFTAVKIEKMYLDGLKRARNLHPSWGIIHAMV